MICESLRAVFVAVAMIAASPSRGTPLLKWVEPAYTVRHHGIEDWHQERYWIFESDWNYDLGCRTYSQRQVTRWEWLATEVVSWPEGDEEPG